MTVVNVFNTRSRVFIPMRGMTYILQLGLNSNYISSHSIDLQWNPRSHVHTRSIIALEDSIYKSVREEKLWKDVLGKEVEFYSSEISARFLGRF